MFENTEKWRDGLEKAKTLTQTLAAMQGTITKSADNLYNALQTNDQLGETLTALFVYAKMYFDQNKRLRAFENTRRGIGHLRESAPPDNYCY